jgi:NAD(P)H-dependent FMN reductase
MTITEEKRDMSNPYFLVIIGSVRPQRIGPDVARWVADLGMSVMRARFEVIDLRDWPLPMDDEPDIPAQGKYKQQHTLAWSRKVAGADGIVFVTPQYNWGYPAPLKNAIDHLYAEWRDKPAAIVTYGGHGGGKCAAQLREVLSGLKMRVVGTMPALTLPVGQIQTNSGGIDPDTAFAPDRTTIIAALHELNHRGREDV